MLLMRQLMAAVDGKPIVTDEEVSLKLVAGAMMCSIGPRSELEGMLVVQMVALHHAAMNDFAAAGTCPAEDTKQTLLVDATDKCRVFAQQLQLFATLQGREQSK